MRQLPLGVRLRDHATFATFRPGENAAIVSQLHAVATGRHEPVMLLWGEAGSGKSHLLQAACAAADGAGRRAAYLPLAPSAPREEPDILDGWETLELACLDDVHLIAGQGAWERALLRVIEGAREQGGTVLLAVRASPGSLSWRYPDVSSRAMSGPVFRLRALSDLDRLEVLKQRASRRGFELPEETGRYLLRRCRRDMHSLCALLDRLDEASLVAQRRLTVPFVKRVIGDRRVPEPDS